MYDIALQFKEIAIAAEFALNGRDNIRKGNNNFIFNP